MRGLHFQKGEYAQAKLVRVIQGSVLDVVVDVRKSSSTYGKYFTIILSGKNKKQLFSRKKVMISRRRARYLDLDNKIYNHISEDISARLSEINRLFESVLLITKNRNIKDFNLSKKNKGEPLIISPLNFDIHNSKIVDDEEIIKLEDNSFDLIISDLIIHTSNNDFKS